VSWGCAFLLTCVAFLGYVNRLQTCAFTWKVLYFLWNTKACYESHPDEADRGSMWWSITGNLLSHFCLLSFNRHIASFLSVFKLVLIGLIIVGKDPFAFFGMQAPSIWQWGQENKVNCRLSSGFEKQCQNGFVRMLWGAECCHWPHFCMLISTALWLRWLLVWFLASFQAGDAVEGHLQSALLVKMQHGLLKEACSY